MKVFCEKEIKIVEISITETVCNKCEKSMQPDTMMPDWIGGCQIDILFGYGSNKDGEKHKLDLCDDCYDEFISTFKIKVADG